MDLEKFEFLNKQLDYVTLVKDLKISYSTGESLSEALIFASTNPQYDDRLFI